MRKGIAALLAAMMLAPSFPAAAESTEQLYTERPYAEMLLSLCSAIGENGYDSIDHFTPEKVSEDPDLDENAGAYLSTKWIDDGQGGSDLGETLFTLKDLNNDGIQELAVTAAHDNVDALYTIEEGEVKLLGVYAYRNTAKIRDNRIIAESGISGEDYIFVSMKLSLNSQLETVDGYFTQRDEKGVVHYLKTDESEITKQQADRIRERSIEGKEPQWYRLFDFEEVFREAVNSPKMKEVQNAAGGVEITWEAFDGAESYCVLRKSSGSEQWVQIGTTGELVFLDETAQSGTEYAYSVCSVTADGKEKLSSFDLLGLKTLYIAAPKLLSLSNTDNGIEFSWEKSGGAVSYRIFRSEKGIGRWERLADISGTVYMDPFTEDGKEYVYTVRAVSPDGSRYLSSYDPEGISICRICPDSIETPSLSSSESGNFVFSSERVNDGKTSPGFRIWILCGTFAVLASGVFLAVLFQTKRK